MILYNRYFVDCKTDEDNMSSKRLFLEKLARDAGKLMMDHWQKEVDVFQKADDTIVTEVDLQISEMVCDRITKAYPQSAILTEETHKHLYFPKETGFIVDELDGTYSFVNGRSGFNFQCAYYENYGELSLGLIYDPLRDIVLCGVKGKGVTITEKGVTKAILPFSEVEWDHLKYGHHRMFQSRTHKKMYEKLGVSDDRIIATGSIGSKVIEVAQGNVDVLIALNRNIAAWDWAPGKVILEELGFCLYHLTGEEVALTDPRIKRKRTFGYLACPVTHLDKFQSELRWIGEKLTGRNKKATAKV